MHRCRLLITASCFLPYAPDSFTLLGRHLSDRLQTTVVQQIGKQRAIVNHRLAEFFNPDILMFVANRNLVRDAIILHDRRMIHRNVGDSLLEIRDRIAAHAHYFLDQNVGICHRGLRIINEARLGVFPSIGKFRPLLIVKRFDVELGHTLLPLLQELFGMSGVAIVCAHCPIVFGSEL